jgi:hypothetical protein
MPASFWRKIITREMYTKVGKEIQKILTEARMLINSAADHPPMPTLIKEPQ